MSTIIIITPPPKKEQKMVLRHVIEVAEGAEILENGQSIASFIGENAYDNAIKYLKVMKW
jgi:hypothetical protein